MATDKCVVCNKPTEKAVSLFGIVTKPFCSKKCFEEYDINKPGAK